MKDRPEESAGKARPGDITPETKVGDMLARFPQLEEVLLRLSPAFSKLRNPVLRKTLARVATLRQVARLGDFPLGDLINTLREAAGIDVRVEGGPEFLDDDLTPAPGWFSRERIVKTFDARPVIAAGGSPLGTVLNDLRELSEGEIYELITPFLPAPLVDTVRKNGYTPWSREESPGVVKTFIRRA